MVRAVDVVARLGLHQVGLVAGGNRRFCLGDLFIGRDGRRPAKVRRVVGEVDVAPELQVSDLEGRPQNLDKEKCQFLGGARFGLFSLHKYYFILNFFNNR